LRAISPARPAPTSISFQRDGWLACGRTFRHFFITISNSPALATALPNDHFRKTLGLASLATAKTA